MCQRMCVAGIMNLWLCVWHALVAKNLPLELSRRMAFTAISLSPSRHSFSNTIYTASRLFRFVAYCSTFCLIMKLVSSSCIWGRVSFVGFKRDDLCVLPSDMTVKSHWENYHRLGRVSFVGFKRDDMRVLTGDMTVRILWEDYRRLGRVSFISSKQDDVYISFIRTLGTHNNQIIVTSRNTRVRTRSVRIFH